MKKTILFLILTLVFQIKESAYPQNAPIQIGTQVSDPLVPGNNEDAANGTHYSNWGVGGLHNVTRHTQMDSIYTVITNRNQEIKGTLCYVSDSSRYYVYDDATWSELEMGKWKSNGIDIYYDNGNIGIGTDTPTEMLDVDGSIKLNDVFKSNDTTLFGIEVVSSFPRLDSLLITGGTISDYVRVGDSLYFSDGINIFPTRVFSIDYLFPPPPAKTAITINPAVPNLDYDTLYRSEVFILNINNSSYVDGTIYSRDGFNIYGLGGHQIRQGGASLMSVINQNLTLGDNQIKDGDLGVRNVITGETIGYGETFFTNSNILYGSDMYSPNAGGNFSSDTNVIVGWHMLQTLLDSAYISHNILIGTMQADLMDTIKGNIWIGNDIYFNPSLSDPSFLNTFILGMNPNKSVNYIDTTNALMSGIFAPDDLEKQKLRVNGNLTVTGNLEVAGELTEDGNAVCRWRGNLEAPPESAQDGDMFYDEGVSSLFIYYNHAWNKK